MTVNIFSRQEVSEHHDTHSLWVIYKDQEFLESHPGGEEILLQYGGKDITTVLSDPMEHVHSDSAYEMLKEYYIGDLDNQKQTTTKQRPFIDYTKPMLYQVWTSNFTKEEYVKQVHIPRHCKGSAPLFGSPYLEVFSKTKWWVIPIFWTPIITYCLKDAIKQQGLETAIALFPCGLFLWTFIEYSLHRFLFHLDDLLPDNRVCITLHFLLHGVHHFLPMDRYFILTRLRLVMPPALGFALAYPIWSLLAILFPNGVGQGIVAGAMTGFVLYDLMHYFLHHGTPFLQYFREMKTYHLDHHYKNANLGYGITSKLWDWVFNTTLR